MAWVEQNKSRGTTMYRGRYRDPLGRPKTAGKSTSKRAAIKMAHDEEHKLRSGTWLDPKAGRITFSEYFEQQCARGAAVRSRLGHAGGAVGGALHD